MILEYQFISPCSIYPTNVFPEYNVHVRVNKSNARATCPHANVIKYSRQAGDETETQPRRAERDSRRATCSHSPANHFTGDSIADSTHNGGNFDSSAFGLASLTHSPLRPIITPYIGDNIFFVFAFVIARGEQAESKMGALRRIKTKRRTRYALLNGGFAQFEMGEANSL